MEKKVFTTDKMCPSEGIENTFVTQSQITSCADSVTFEETVDCVDAGDGTCGQGASGADGKQTLVAIVALVVVALTLA